MSEPVLIGLLFADRVITEKNGKKGIIGTFNRFYSPDFPVAFPPWSIYAACTNLIGSHHFEVKLSRIGDEKPIIPISGNIDVRDKSDVVELSFNIVGATFPGPGEYILSFSVGGELLSTRMLMVTKTDPSQLPKGTPH